MSLKHSIRGALSLALLTASHAALALGLGEIRVLSQPGQPLLAEIPVIPSEPGELEQLRAQLASPAVFERVGLGRPTGLVSQLDFAVAVASNGDPIVRVTSQQPVTTPSLSFLVEVDWAQGRLVREYSALIGAPRSLASETAPQIQAPTPAPSNRVETQLPSTSSTAQNVPIPNQVPVAVAPLPLARPEQPSPKPVVAKPAPVMQAQDVDVLTVKKGQTLWEIARSIQRDGTLDQTMIALLRANPKAFIGNNINRLRSGVRLRLPTETETQSLASAQASMMVRQQMADWSRARQPVPQPAGNAPQGKQSTVAQTAVADARLEIAPPAADAAERGGATSGTQAGGEGDMLDNAQLRQAREDLAARDAELQELKAQVAELEKIKDQQAQLIALKNSDLAAAQNNLNKAQESSSELVPTWMWASGGGLIVVALLIWVLIRRRRNREFEEFGQSIHDDLDTARIRTVDGGPSSSFAATSSSAHGGVPPIPFDNNASIQFDELDEFSRQHQTRP